MLIEKYEDKLRKEQVGFGFQERQVGQDANVKMEETSSTIKVDDADLARIRELQRKYSEVMVEFGALKVEKIATQKTWTLLLQREKELETLYLQLQDEEELMAKEFGEKYGQGRLNMDTGEFTKK